MATHALRLRRSLHLASTILNHHRHFSPVLSSVAASPTPASSPTSATRQNPSAFDATPQSRPNSLPFRFVCSRDFSSRPRFSNNMNEEEIGPDTILFEGCDYNHWLITMDFPKDPPPTPEEMVDTYVKTAAQVLGSEEEAKKKIYACSTTTYQGFQVEVSEEVSEKFRGLPGVVFILPDSYIDPVNKEYGGDKYINGTIIPRPPPVQYGRQGGRYNDRNRDYNRSSRGPMRQNPPPQQNYGDRTPMNNAAVAQNTYQGDGRGPMSSYQGSYNYNPPGQAGFPPSDQRTYPPPEQRDFRGDGKNFAPTQRGSYMEGGGPNYGQGTGGQYGQGGGGNYGQGIGGQHGQGGGGNYGQGIGGQQGGGGNYGQGTGGQQGGGGNYGQGTGGQYGHGGVGGYGQGTGYSQGTGGQFSQGGARSYGHVQGGVGSSGQGSAGNYGQPTFAHNGQGGAGNYRQGTDGNYRQDATGQHGQGWGQGVGRPYGQETGSGYSQVSSQYGGNPSFPQMEQRNNVQGRQDELVDHKN